MSRFPRQYAESTLNRMYKKLELSDDIIKLLEDYFDAFANLYNILPLEDAFGIINEQNKDLLTKEKFIAFPRSCGMICLRADFIIFWVLMSCIMMRQSLSLWSA